MSDQKNLAIAIGLSLLILLGWQFLYENPRLEKELQRKEQLAAEQAANGGGTANESATPSPSEAPGASPLPSVAPKVAESREEALKSAARVQIASPRVKGSIALTGARIDDIILTDYRETQDEESDFIHLLNPAGLTKPYYAEFGWVGAPNANLKLPSPDSVWTSTASTLAPGSPITLSWDNGEGLVFERDIAIDENFMLTVNQRVRNSGSNPVVLYPYGLISRGGTPETIDFYILHEGPLGVFGDTLSEFDYEDLQDAGKIDIKAEGGWIGLTDKYWLAALIPEKAKPWTYNFRHSIRRQTDRYQVDYLGEAVALSPGATISNNAMLFAGAKQVELMDTYAEDLGIVNFDLAIDFGWFFYLTKPFFYSLIWLNSILGNFGLAILAFTVVIKLILFPLANKSYRSMARLKELTPKMQELREKYGEDKARMNEEMMALYKREKVNPASGCLPIFVQIPVFFALYKVLFISIEMRHSPFYGWIQDLSAPDPTTIFNLFGLIPWTPPELLMIGAWPVIMGATMFLQQKLNPQPADPVQAKVFMFLPLVFTVLLANFAAGLVIYWTWNNLLSILQQYVIMKRAGVKNALA